MKRILCAFAIVMTALSAVAKDGDGHRLTALWADYKKAVKADRPKKQASTLEEIKRQAEANRLAWDFYDASREYVRLRSESNWKLREDLTRQMEQELGFLPGDQKAKMTPFLQPLMDNLNVIKAQFRPSSREALRIESMLSQEKLIIEPLAYIRGRSLGKCYFIIDEAQNLTPHEIKTIITRAGEGTKMVFTGDIFQIDQPYLDQWSNGLTHLGEKMAGQRIFQHIFLRRGERSRLSELAAKLL